MFSKSQACRENVAPTLPQNLKPSKSRRYCYSPCSFGIKADAAAVFARRLFIKKARM